MNILFPILSLFLVLGFAPVYGGGKDSLQRELFLDGEVLVKYRATAKHSYAQKMELYKQLGVLDVEHLSGGLENSYDRMFFKKSADIQEVIARLRAMPEVESAQPNYWIYAVPLDDTGKELPQGCIPPGTNCPLVIAQRPQIPPLPSEPPAKPDPDLDKLYGMRLIQATKAWGLERGSKSVLVAVIDSGVDYTHPNLAYNIWRNPQANAFQKTGVDATGDSVTGDIVGWDFVHNDNLPYDDVMHGTHCAGVIGAVGGAGLGISGVSPRVSLIAIKFISSAGSGPTSDAIKSIDYAISRGAKILSNSWGSKVDDGDNQALEEAIHRAEKKGVLFVASAGNAATNNDQEPDFPASFPSPNIITVAATDSRDNLAVFSNYGAKSVHVAAPGVGIYSTIPQGHYKSLSGTSMAAPHVAGAAALLWARFPRANYREIKRRLLTYGDDVRELAGKTTTGKRINLYRALTGR